MFLVGSKSAREPSSTAQTTYGSIVGTVTDSSGAVVPDASVTVTNIGTGQVLKTQSDAGGAYSVVSLLPADYKVAVEKASFKRLERPRVPVQVGAVIRIDLSMAVGNVSEVVEVSTAVPLLQTDTSSLNQQVQGDVVQQMPLNGRNVMNLVELAPGVVPTGASSGGTGLDQSAGRTAGGIGWNNYQIGGAIQGWSAEFIDGVPNQLLGDNVVALVPTQDAVQEFSVVSSNATADYGRFAGGVINMSTRAAATHFTAPRMITSATLRSMPTITLTSSWRPPRGKRINPRNGIRTNTARRSMGPSSGTKLFSCLPGRTLKLLRPHSILSWCLPGAMQNGTVNHAITDPLGNCNIVNNGNGTWTITNLYGPGLISGTCGDPLNRVLKELWPLPNANGSSANWLLNSWSQNTQKQYNGRVDYQLGAKQRLFGRYTYWTLADNHNSILGNVGFTRPLAAPPQPNGPLPPTRPKCSRSRECWEIPTC